jgi:hypothetical protein
VAITGGSYKLFGKERIALSVSHPPRGISEEEGATYLLAGRYLFSLSHTFQNFPCSCCVGDPTSERRLMGKVLEGLHGC